MQITLDDLIEHINHSNVAELLIYIYGGSGYGLLPSKVFKEELRVSRDENGAVFLGDEETKQGYWLDDSCDIESESDLDGTYESCYVIREEDGILMLQLALK